MQVHVPVGLQFEDLIDELGLEDFEYLEVANWWEF